MRVLLFGATGMVGQGVLRECLIDPRVESVLVVGRTSVGVQSPKLAELLRPDVGDFSGVEERLRGYDACFFCLGISSAGKSEEDYRRITHDLTIRVAQTLVRLNPGMTFVYITGAGTDSTEQTGSMWARVKGQTENELLRMGFKGAYMFRPGVIQALHGIRPRSTTYRVLYTVLWPVIMLVKAVAPGSMTTTERVGRAMIHVAIDGAPSPILGTREINRLGA